MSDLNMTSPYEDPVAYLAAFGIHAELVTVEESVLPEAA